MKKLVLIVLMALFISVIVLAQPAAPTATIGGTLSLTNGRTTVISENITYYIRGLELYIGSIDGLKEGAQVLLEGYIFDPPPGRGGQGVKVFQPIQLTLGGKNYEINSHMPENRGLGRGGRDTTRGI